MSLIKKSFQDLQKLTIKKRRDRNNETTYLQTKKNSILLYELQKIVYYRASYARRALNFRVFINLIFLNIK
jgi:hypothetical protein